MYETLHPVTGILGTRNLHSDSPYESIVMCFHSEHPVSGSVNGHLRGRGSWKTTLRPETLSVSRRRLCRLGTIRGAIRVLQGFLNRGLWISKDPLRVAGFRVSGRIRFISSTLIYHSYDRISGSSYGTSFLIQAQL